MTTRDYADYVERRAQPFTDLNYCVIALNGESGEVAEWYKKCVLRGNPEGKHSDEDLKKELGDVLFYLQRICNLKGWTLEDIMERNRQKLDKRVERGALVG